MNRAESENPITKSANVRPRHTVPAGEPAQIHEIAPRLLATYTVDGGHAHLAGCRLENVAVVRISLAQRTGNERAAKERATWHLLFDAQNPKGRSLDPEFVDELNLGDLQPAEQPGSVSTQQVDELVAAAKTYVRNQGADVESADVTLIWCKFASGKLELSIADKSVNVPFSGWVRMLAPPACHCAITGVETFHVAAVDDGRVVAADEIARCEESGKRLPNRELVRCGATGRLVDPALTVVCPASGEAVLADRKIACPMCRQKVSPAAIRGNRCQVCRRLERVAKSDPRLAPIRALYPELDAWSAVKLAETEPYLVLVVSNAFAKRLLVLEADSLAPLHAARGSRLLPGWKTAPEQERKRILKTG